MSTQPESSTDPKLRWGISREELDRRKRMPAKPVRPNEYRCPECNLRVTVTKSGIEVGHARGRKDHRPLCPNYSGPHAESDRDAERQSTLGGW